MYLPATELQQYKGQWFCPYCIMDAREEDRAPDRYKAPEPQPGKSDTLIQRESCERCTAEAKIIYHYRGMRLCSSCVNEAKKDWETVSSDKPPQMPFRISTEKAQKSYVIPFFNSLFDRLLQYLRLKKKKETVAAKKPREQLQHAPPPVLMSAAKPLKEEALPSVQTKEKEKQEYAGKKETSKKEPASVSVEEEREPMLETNIMSLGSGEQPKQKTQKQKKKKSRKRAVKKKK